jgi:hypothetical protein
MASVFAESCLSNPQQFLRYFLLEKFVFADGAKPEKEFAPSFFFAGFHI